MKSGMKVLNRMIAASLSAIIVLSAMFGSMKAGDRHCPEEKPPLQEELSTRDPVPQKVEEEKQETEQAPKVTKLNLVVIEEPDKEADPDGLVLVPPTLETAENIKEPELRSIGTFAITAYCPCEICCGWYALNRPLDENGEPIIYTASGARAEAGTTIAVDTSVLPHGTEVFFEGPDGITEDYTAQDTGSAVGGHHIDLFFDDHEAACNWGLQYREVFVEVPTNG